MYDDFDPKNTERKEEPRTINTYDPNMLKKKKAKKPSGWKKGLVIFLIIVLVIVGAGVSCSMGVERALGTSGSDDFNYSGNYIGVLEVHGSMGESDSSSETYNQQWLLERIDQMENDSFNQGLILSVDTPGGSVYSVDELYLKIKEYKETTGRPVYTYMESMAASGGYYIAAGTEKIYANRNCWTGSIGVTIGTLYDFSGFLEKMGVKTVTITSGENKAMGSAVDPLTDEQKEIFQSLVDEAYEQFISIVADGRKMDIEEAKKLGDGRIYTAKQAKENGLIDEIGTLNDAVYAMQKAYELEDCEVQTISYVPEESFLSFLMGYAGDKTNTVKGEYEQLMEIMDENSAFTITYMSPVRK